MDDLSDINASNCADLDRLATAAATLGYSSNPSLLPSQVIVTTGNGTDLVPNGGLIPTTTALMTSQYPSDPYDLSRPHQHQQQLQQQQQQAQHPQYTTIRLAEYHEPLVDSGKETFGTIHPSAMNQMMHNPPNVQRMAAGTTHYTVIQRADIATQTNPDRSLQQSLALPLGTTTTSIRYIDARNGIIEPGLIVSPSQPPQTLQIVTTNQLNSVSPIIHFINQEVVAAQNDASIVVEEVDMPSLVIKDAPKKPVKKPKKRSTRTDSVKSSEALKKEMEIKKILDEVPEPVDIDGKKYFVCKLCNEKFIRKYLFKRHQIVHTGEKRGALSLETKAEIIRRIKAGEKQVDLAMEYNVGRSTLSFIMKNSEKFLGVLKDGKFLPDSKRLRGAHREDVEEALYEWYKQANKLNMTVSGPILCKKAKDFALKLGYPDFKATHGWLDRFKHRKQIMLGRGRNVKEKEHEEEDTEEFKIDFDHRILPTILAEYDSNDVFCAQEIGLLYKVLPDEALLYKGMRCAGGKHSKNRLTVLLCTNMTGSEKFPLMVVGKYSKPKCFKNIKSLPVQYLAERKAWIDKEKFFAWLNDLNSWFVKQNRKVLLFIPSLPIHPKATKLSAVKLVITPKSFKGPIDLGIALTLKRNYRRGTLEALSNKLDEIVKLRKKTRKSDFKLTLLTCLHKLAAAWHAITDVTINNSFQKCGMGKYNMVGWNTNNPTETVLGTENLNLIHKMKASGMKIDDCLNFDDFVSFDDDVQVCHIMNDDDILASVSGIQTESSDSEEEEVQSSLKDENDKENGAPSYEEAERHLLVLRNHITKHPRASQEMVNMVVCLENLIQETNHNSNVTDMAIHELPLVPL